MNNELNFLTEGKKKGNKSNVHEKPSNQDKSTSKSILEQQKKNQEEKTQQLQNNQPEQLISVQPNEVISQVK